MDKKVEMMMDKAMDMYGSCVRKETLEECAKSCDMTSRAPEGEDDYDKGYRDAAEACAQDIRKMK